MADFDALASIYDSDFTHSIIGKRQRKVVWNYLKKQVGEHLDILELNGGTGEDAIFLAKQGHKVLTTDRSTEMLKASCQKFKNIETKYPIRLKQLDLNQASLHDQTAKFNLVFSNFGGLNCIDKTALNQLKNFIDSRLKANGSAILIIMPKDTLLEKLYRRWTGQHGLILARQNEEGTEVSVAGDLVRTYFYNPNEIQKIFTGYTLKHSFITGLIPSYLEGKIQKYKTLFYPIFLLESVLIKTKRFSHWGDHFLIHLQKD